MAVAVPLPLPTPLTYSVPAGLRTAVAPGARVRVPVGRRSVTGVVVGLPDAPPEGVSLKPIAALLDLDPVLPESLLELAGFVADYYLQPIGQVVEAMLPAGLGALGRRRVRLTAAGAVAPPASAEEGRLVDALREAGELDVSDLRRAMGEGGRAPADLPDLLERLARRGRISLTGAPRGGARYVKGVELPPGRDLEAQLEACGRSPKGREVVRHLADVGRPATVDEVCSEVGCGAGVVRRLVKLGVLREFTQVERSGLDRHLLASRGESEIVLRPDQRRAAGELVSAVERGGFAPFLLHGMTGSGKTEVYLRAAAAALERGLSAVVLVPEIALVPALARTLRERFGEALAILHSALSGGERRQEWERIRDGEARLVLGPRSAVFAPVERLGLVVVDEEQDGAYKQESTPRYHGRDLALVRGRREGATVLLVSATPSLEARRNVDLGKLSPLRLTERVGSGRLPQGIIVDLKAEGVPRHPGEARFSRRLVREIAEALDRDEQVILLRNRRGYAPMLLCRACGEDGRCEDCGLPRTLHRRRARLVCHYCGSERPEPERCPACGEAALEPVGTGTERVEERFRELFPGVPVEVLDRDAASRPGGATAVLERFAGGRARVLVGTQMVSKGHHFPRVSLAGVLLADSYMGFPDFRAVERTYALLTQVAGRAGRGDAPGRVVIQTYQPDHYAVQSALSGDDAGFAREEMRFREVFHYPPFTRMVQLLVEERNRERGLERLREVAGRIEAHPLRRRLRLSGPAPAPFERLRGRWRFQLLLRGRSGSEMRRVVADALPDPVPRELTVDVDPLHLL